MTIKKQIWQNPLFLVIFSVGLSSLVTWGVTQYRKHERDKVDKAIARVNDSVQTARINTLYKLMDKKLDKDVWEQYERDQNK